MAVATKETSTVNIEQRKNADIRAGDTVRVWQKITEGGKTRLQAFEGLVIARKHGREPGATFTVRKVTSGVGVEKIFPLYAPMIDKIEIVKRSKVRRAKLYYIREKAAREIKKKMKQMRFAAQEVVNEEKIRKEAEERAKAEAEAKEQEEAAEHEAREKVSEEAGTKDEAKAEEQSGAEDAQTEEAPEAEKEEKT